MRGEITISDETVDMLPELTAFDLFKIQLVMLTNSDKGGWYAYKHGNKVWRFKWALWLKDIKTTSKYLKHLKNDGWVIGVPISD